MNKKSYISEQCNITNSEIFTPIREQMACSEFDRENTTILKECIKNTYNSTTKRQTT